MQNEVAISKEVPCHEDSEFHNLLTERPGGGVEGIGELKAEDLELESRHAYEGKRDSEREGTPTQTAYHLLRGL